MSRMSRLSFVLCLPVAICASLTALAQATDGTGRISGRVTAVDGRGHGGITVQLDPIGATTLTDGEGAFNFLRVPAGTYSLTLTHETQTMTHDNVVVIAGSSTRVDITTRWELTFSESLTVFSASRKEERLVDAPSAVTVVDEREIEKEASHGQLPKLLEFTPGAEVTQSGIYDYNFNTRGFNSSLNRRVATLIDGRDPSVPFLGAQEWASISFPLDDISSLEFVRGPSAALYGANAASGVLNISTKSPRYSEGGIVRLTGGELSTFNGDVRFAGPIGDGWYWKFTGGVRDSGDFSLSRNGAAEYSMPCPVPQGTATDCLPQEAVPLARQDDNKIYFGSVRVDKYTASGANFTVEAGYADLAGPVFQTGIGRVQLLDVQRPWLRTNYARPHWNLLAYYNKREADRQLALASGANLALDSENWQVELQTNWEIGDRARFVGGASYGEEDIDSRDPATGLQTLTFEPIEADFTALFGQFDWQISDPLKLVVATRWDDSSLHDSQFSPKAALVWSVAETHTLRFTYNEAFQVANYSEFFLFAPAATPANTAMLEGICVASGVLDCGLVRLDTNGDMIPESLPVLALGNESLELEEVRTFEVGYAGILGSRSFLTADYYFSKNENFITDLLPLVGTPLGSINPNYGVWIGSTAAETTPVNPALGFPVGFTVADAVRAGSASELGPLGVLLTNDPAGASIIGARTYTNFGRVDTQGVDLGLRYYIDDAWHLDANYSWFDFDIKETEPGLDDLLLPNSPENKVAVGLSYDVERWDARIGARWVDEFRWTVGPFQGDVESYTTVDLSGNWRFGDGWSAGLNVANALDDEHWEAFGGDLLGRRALAHLAYAW